MRNVDAARSLISALRSAGVQEFCVCAGSRNGPLLAVLGSSGVRLYSFVDERSAAFFALGRIKLTEAPVAVVTTSGTAVAELLPATIEAFYAGLPLILVSADRPSRFRGTGAPQSIDQIGIFGVHAETSLNEWSRRRPLHLNIEFDEPLIDGPLLPAPLDAPSASDAFEPQAPPADIPFARPLVIIGALPRARRERVREFVRSLGAPVVAEPLSGLREDAGLPHIIGGERMIPRGTFDSVIRIGGVPTLRFWRDLENQALPVLHFTDLPFAGMTRGALLPLASLPPNPEARPAPEGFHREDRAMAAAIHEIVSSEPESELAMLRRLSESLPERSRVYLGNSLPIREWDLVASREPRLVEYEANRGANGIDGQLSTFFGQCDPDTENVCVLGDLTAIYDLGAPWIVPQLGSIRFRIMIVNNAGGRIFGRVASLRDLDPSLRERIIENVHGVRFDEWARMWSLGERVVELRPDEDASARVWKRYDELWR